MKDEVIIELERKREENFRYFSDSFKKQLFDDDKKIRKSQSFETVKDRIKEEEILREARLKNDGIEQDITLKKKTLDLLFKFLAGETVIIFTIAFFQGFQFYNFFLDELSFRIVVSATITQITVMLVIAVKHLFPNK